MIRSSSKRKLDDFVEEAKESVEGVNDSGRDKTARVRMCRSSSAAYSPENLYCAEVLRERRQGNIRTFAPRPLGELRDSAFSSFAALALQSPRTVRPAEPAVSKIAAKRERRATAHRLFNRCREQHAKSHFALDAEQAMRSLPVVWRVRLIEWLQVVCLQSKDAICTTTIAHAVSLLDSYVAKCEQHDVPKNPSQYQLCAITAFTLACKFCERTKVSRHIWMEFGVRFQPQLVAACERKMLAVLDWQVYPATVHVLTGVLLDEICDQLKRSSVPNAAKTCKKLRTIATVFLDLQLSSATLLSYSRPAVVLGTVAAACNLYNINFCRSFADTANDLFIPEEVAQCNKICHECQTNFASSFPDMATRCPSPQTVMDVQQLESHC